MVSTNFVEEINGLNAQIREKQNKDSDVVRDMATLRAQIRLYEVALRDKAKEHLRYIEVIRKLNAAVTALQALNVPATTPDLPTGWKPATIGAAVPMRDNDVVHTYKTVGSVSHRSYSGNYYEIETVLVDRSYFVYKCECEAFRFTRGELASGKTCKHIQRHTSIQVKSVANAAARIAARKCFPRGVRFVGTAFHDTYQFRRN